MSTNPRTTMTADWLLPGLRHTARSCSPASIVVALAWTYPLLGAGSEDGEMESFFVTSLSRRMRAKLSADPV